MEFSFILNMIRGRWIERQSRFDEEEPDAWITVRGNHIPLDEDKKPIGGQTKVFGGDNEKRAKELEDQISKLSRFGEAGKKRAELKAELDQLKGKPEKPKAEPKPRTMPGAKQAMAKQSSLPITGEKKKQFEIIQKTNPMLDDIHTGIRSAGDIKNAEEAFKMAITDDDYLYPDFKKEDGEKALKSGKITVYSSKPISQGGFVSPSKMMAQDYAGNGKVYSEEIDIDDVAWIDCNEGQIARTVDQDDKRFKELEKKAKKWQEENPFDPFKAFIGEWEEPDFVKEYERMVEESESKKNEERWNAIWDAERKKEEEWKDNHAVEPYSAKRQYELNKYASKIGYNVVTKSMAKDFSDEEIHSIIDRINEVQKEFGIDPGRHPIVYGIASADGGYQKFLDGVGGSGGIGVDGVITFDPRKRRKYGESGYRVVHHEAAHGVNMALAEAMGESTFGWGGVERVAKMVVEDALKKRNGENKDKLFTNISSYAGRRGSGDYDYKEILAECVGNYMNDKNRASGFENDVVNVLKDYCKKYMR